MDEEHRSPLEPDRPVAQAMRAAAPTARAAAQRELERARRAEVARIAALVRYMLYDRAEPLSASTKAARR
jgi:hypothetical protein